MNREEMLYRMPLLRFMQGYGHEFKRSGSEYATLCPFHDDHTPSLYVNESKNVWTCRSCGAGGTVIDFMARKENLSIAEAMKQISDKLGQGQDQPKRTQRGDVKMHKVATYEYKDEHGKPVFYVDRTEADAIPDGKKKPPKSFAQYHYESGKQIMGITGIRRVLYRLPEVLANDEIFVAEGEKCVHALEAMGKVATCNPAGGNSWLAPYGEFLRDRHVTVMPDNDDKGWAKDVMDSCRGKVATVRLAKVGEEYNDIADMVDFHGAEAACQQLDDILLDIPRVPKGIDSPLTSMDTLYRQYTDQVNDERRAVVDLAAWLPSMRESPGARMRPIVRGEMIVLAAATGKGKSAAAMNIVHAHKHLNTVLFSLELPGTDIAERAVAMQHSMPAYLVEQRVKGGSVLSVADWKKCLVCDECGVSLDRMAKVIEESELLFGSPPDLFVADYMGLMAGGKGSRYERMSAIADGLKELAKKTNTVALVISQIGRKKDDDNDEVQLHDAKDSGNIEQSAQVVLGMWRPDSDTAVVRVNKSTKGGAGITVWCDFNGPTLQITQRGTSTTDNEFNEEQEGT